MHPLSLCVSVLDYFSSFSECLFGHAEVNDFLVVLIRESVVFEGANTIENVDFVLEGCTKSKVM